MEFFGSDSDDDGIDPLQELLAACMRIVPPLAGRRPALRLMDHAGRFATQAAAAGFDVVDGDCDVVLIASVYDFSRLPCGVVAALGQTGEIPGWETAWAGDGAAVYRKLPAVDRVGCPPRPPARRSGWGERKRARAATARRTSAAESRSNSHAECLKKSRGASPGHRVRAGRDGKAVFEIKSKKATGDGRKSKHGSGQAPPLTASSAER